MVRTLEEEVRSEGMRSHVLCLESAMQGTCTVVVPPARLPFQDSGLECALQQLLPAVSHLRSIREQREALRCSFKSARACQYKANERY